MYIIGFIKVFTWLGFKYNVIKNFLRGKSYKNKITYALDRLSYEQDKVAQQFYEMFDDNNYEKWGI